MFYLSYYYQSKVNTWMYLRRAITLQVDGYHNLNPLEMICINFHIATQSILMYHSVVKVLKNLGLEVFKIKLQSSIYNIACYASTSYAHAVLLCCLLEITSVYTSKKVVIHQIKTPWV